MIEELKESIDYCLNCKKPPSMCDYCTGLKPKKKKRKSAIPAWKEEKIREMLMAGKKITAIALACKVSNTTVWNRRKEIENG